MEDRLAALVLMRERPDTLLRLVSTPSLYGQNWDMAWNGQFAGLTPKQFSQITGPVPGISDDDAMKEAMKKGERIELRGFGVFVVKPRKRGIGRNPRTGTEVAIPEGKTIRFKPGKELQS